MLLLLFGVTLIFPPWILVVPLVSQNHTYKGKTILKAFLGTHLLIIMPFSWIIFMYFITEESFSPLPSPWPAGAQIMMKLSPWFHWKSFSSQQRAWWSSICSKIEPSAVEHVIMTKRVESMSFLPNQYLFREGAISRLVSPPMHAWPLSIPPDYEKFPSFTRHLSSWHDSEETPLNLTLYSRVLKIKDFSEANLASCGAFVNRVLKK